MFDKQRSRVWFQNITILAIHWVYNIKQSHIGSQSYHPTPLKRQTLLDPPSINFAPRFIKASSIQAI